MLKKCLSISRPKYGVIVGVMIALTTLLCSPHTARADSPPLEDTLEKLVLKSSNLEPADGFASYYAKRFEGRRTTSGNRYHPDKMTAAHESLPLGTVVRVVNPATNQEVHVTITDRCARKAFHF